MEDTISIQIVTMGDGDRSLAKFIRFWTLIQKHDPRNVEFFCEKQVVAEVPKYFEIHAATYTENLAQVGYPGDYKELIGNLPNGYDNVYPTIELIVSDTFNDGFIRLLKFLQYMGDVGSSRGIDVKNLKGDIVSLFGWDGDGSDRITSLKIDGKEVSDKKGFGFDRILRASYQYDRRPGCF